MHACSVSCELEKVAGLEMFLVDILPPASSQKPLQLDSC